MSRQRIASALAVVALTLTLAAPLHAAPTGHPPSPGLWARALSWLTSFITPIGQSYNPDQGGMIDPNGSH